MGVGGEEGDDPLDRLLRRAGPEALVGHELPGSRAERAHAPGAAGLDAPVEPGGAHVTAWAASSMRSTHASSGIEVESIVR